MDEQRHVRVDEVVLSILSAQSFSVDAQMRQRLARALAHVLPHVSVHVVAHIVHWT